MSLELMLPPLCMAIHPTSINLLGEERVGFSRGKVRGRVEAERNGIREGQGRVRHRRVRRSSFQWLHWPLREANVQLKQNWPRARLSSAPMGNLHLIWPDRKISCWRMAHRESGKSNQCSITVNNHRLSLSPCVQLGWIVSSFLLCCVYASSDAQISGQWGK